MRVTWLKGAAVVFLLASLALSALAWRQTLLLHDAQVSIARAHSERIGWTIWELQSAADYMEKAQAQEGTERSKSLFWALVVLHEADGNLVALQNAGVLQRDPFANQALMEQLHRQFNAVEQMSLTGTLNGLPEAQAVTRKMYQQLQGAWKASSPQLEQSFRDAVENFR
jgi:hypothetical protein